MKLSYAVRWWSLVAFYWAAAGWGFLLGQSWQ